MKLYLILLGALFVVACDEKQDKLPEKWVAYQLQIEACKRQSRTPFKCEKEVEHVVEFNFQEFVKEMDALRENPKGWKIFQDKVVALLNEQKKQSVKPKVIKKKTSKKKPSKKDSVESKK